MLSRRELDRSLAAAHLTSTVEALDDHPGFSFAFVRRALNRAAHDVLEGGEDTLVVTNDSLEQATPVEDVVQKQGNFTTVDNLVDVADNFCTTPVYGDDFHNFTARVHSSGASIEVESNSPLVENTLQSSNDDLNGID
ncbi:hypothetical protein V6N12_008177 [Hibiscus sabdariffa]|uniref:Uncharacterized protein n=1 Tax=Hibiscus sabdariffa TaxID=183260 RepID=A0ABR2B309_9ROSI